MSLEGRYENVAAILMSIPVVEPDQHQLHMCESGLRCPVNRHIRLDFIHNCSVPPSTNHICLTDYRMALYINFGFIEF